MATYFGEVVFPSSRAFWDENEGEELTDELQELQININWLKDKPISMKKLILVEGEIIIGTDMKNFLKEGLCHDAKKICTIQDECNKELAVIYQVNEDLYVCIIARNFDTKLAGEFVIKISDILSISKSIYLITWRHVSQYKSANIPNVPSFLRCLYTKNASDLCKSHKEILEKPNIIYGVAAGILSFAQMMEYQSVLYVLYTDSFVLDSLAAEPLIEIFAEISNQDLHNITFIGKSFFNKGNLYI
ncbi:proteasome assembly chaperone 1 isoform X1 [Vespa velutina]|uniref:proteasome assembly chaperone 1 isoform X1 n=1 Tax=Vespa velutina TaxID=202808 RepID=UPI001FB3FC6C|nr:proteasome assembly chaperone 1 isoform X1 [Vespa velutina]